MTSRQGHIRLLLRAARRDGFPAVREMFRMAGPDVTVEWRDD